MLNENSYSDSSKHTFIRNEHFRVTSCFISVPLLSSFVHFLIFKLFDVLVYIFGQSKLTALLTTDELSQFLPTKYCLFVVCLWLNEQHWGNSFNTVAPQKQITLFITAFAFTVFFHPSANCWVLSNNNILSVMMTRHVTFSAETITNTET